jgi:hypothetical protein
MKWLAPYRLATIVLVLFCAGHTYGGMFAPHDFGAAAEDVFHAMKTVTFRANGAECSWYGFWFGFGITVSLFLALSALTTWRLAGLTRAQRRPLLPITWAMVVTFLALGILSFRYFFAPPAIMSLVIALVIAIESARDGRPAS